MSKAGYEFDLNICINSETLLCVLRTDTEVSTYERIYMDDMWVYSQRGLHLEKSSFNVSAIFSCCAMIHISIRQFYNVFVYCWMLCVDPLNVIKITVSSTTKIIPDQIWG